MVLNVCTTPASMAIKLAPFNVMYNPPFVHRSQDRASLAFPKIKSLGVAYRQRTVLSIKGGSTLNALRASTPLTIGDHGSLARSMPLLPRRGKVPPRSLMVVAVSKSFSYPPTTTKPRWWWRTLACVPYLLPLHEAWLYADTAFRLHPFLENFSFLTDPFIDTYVLLPNWFSMALMYFVYFVVIRRKDLPDFLRFHIVMSTLMSLAFQATAIVCGWMPGVVFEGRMACLWLAAAFVQMLVVLKCMRCSLSGMYADVPVMTDAAKTNLSV